jgi:hypothetical protein
MACSLSGSVTAKLQALYNETVNWVVHADDGRVCLCGAVAVIEVDERLLDL